jgi:hypothetical protein
MSSVQEDQEEQLLVRLDTFALLSISKHTVLLADGLFNYMLRLVV